MLSFTSAQIFLMFLFLKFNGFLGHIEGMGKEIEYA